MNPIISEAVVMPIDSGVVENLEMKLKFTSKFEQYRYKSETHDHTESNSFIEDPIMSPRNPDSIKQVKKSKNEEKKLSTIKSSVYHQQKLDLTI